MCQALCLQKKYLPSWSLQSRIKPNNESNHKKKSWTLPDHRRRETQSREELQDRAGTLENKNLKEKYHFWRNF